MTPIHKAGPHVVREVSNLRTISISTDLARIQDSLWLMRWVHVLADFAGPGQAGGRTDAVSILLSLFLHAQLRREQLLETHWASTDLISAFEQAF